jgi:CRISPR-associated protein Cmr2
LHIAILLVHFKHFLNFMPKQYIISISIGPVQGLIAAARRTRDLWYGSYLLADISRAAAKFLSDQSNVELIFPSYGSSDATKIKLAFDAIETAPRVVNKITAIVSCSDETLIAALLVNTKKAVFDRFNALAADCIKTISAEINQIDEGRFNLQISDVIETYGAWCEFEPGGPSYKVLNDQLNSLLAARKTLRDFKPNPISNADWLSSLDGERETVLEPLKLSKVIREKFQIGTTEALDAVGLIKRVNGKQYGFPSVSRVALEPWVRAMHAEAPTELKTIANLYDELVKSNLNATSVTVGFKIASLPLANNEIHPLSIFPFDCELMQPNRRNLILGPTDGNGVDKNFEALDAEILKLVEKYSKSKPHLCPPTNLDSAGNYYAMLHADGDKMGFLLDQCNTYQQHQQVSSALSNFAAKVEDIVAQAGGACIYAGGDDVLAIVSVVDAIKLARNLADRFAAILGTELIEKLGLKIADTELPSLSVGLAFAHTLVPMGETLTLARAAESLAKNGHNAEGLRNALGIIVKPRNGAPVTICGRWSDQFDIQIYDWMVAFKENSLSSSAPYDLRELGIGLKPEAKKALANRLIKRRAKDPALIEKIRSRIEDSQLPDEWYVARWLQNQFEQFGLSHASTSTASETKNALS